MCNIVSYRCIPPIIGNTDTQSNFAPVTELKKVFQKFRAGNLNGAHADLNKLNLEYQRCPRIPYLRIVLINRILSSQSLSDDNRRQYIRMAKRDIESIRRIHHPSLIDGLLQTLDRAIISENPDTRHTDAQSFLVEQSRRFWSLRSDSEADWAEDFYLEVTALLDRLKVSFSEQRHPKLFISYAWPVEPQEKDLLQSTLRLVERFFGYFSSGTDNVFLDVSDLRNYNIKRELMEKISNSDFALVIGTPRYKSRAIDPKTNVHHEFTLIKSQAAQRKDFLIPLVLEGEFTTALPDEIQGILSYYLTGTIQNVFDFKSMRNFIKNLFKILETVYDITEKTKPIMYRNYRREYLHLEGILDKYEPLSKPSFFSGHSNFFSSRSHDNGNTHQDNRVKCNIL